MLVSLKFTREWPSRLLNIFTAKVGNLFCMTSMIESMILNISTRVLLFVFTLLMTEQFSSSKYDLKLLSDKNLKKCSSSAISAMNRGPIFVVSERGCFLPKSQHKSRAESYSFQTEFDIWVGCGLEYLNFLLQFVKLF